MLPLLSFYYFRYNVINTTSSSTVSPLKLEIIEKLNKLLKKQTKLKEEYKRTLDSKDKDRSAQSFNPMNLEEGKKVEEDSVQNDDSDSEDKPLFGNYDIVEEDSQIEVNRKRRKNRQRHDEFLMSSSFSDEFEALPDQSQSETITRHSVHKKSPSHLHNFHLPPGNAYTQHKKNDIRLEIPISLDATISLPKNKQSLEELLDFVMKHDASLLEEYLLEKSSYGPQLEVVSPVKTYDLPPAHPPHPQHTTVPDTSHTGYAAVLSPESEYGPPEKHHHHKARSHCLFWETFLCFIMSLIAIVSGIYFAIEKTIGCKMI